MIIIIIWIITFVKPFAPYIQPKALVYSKTITDGSVFVNHLNHNKKGDKDMIAY